MASFLNGYLNITIVTTPLDAPDDMIAWGMIKLATNNRIWIANLYLSPDPAPYGTWRQVDLAMRKGLQPGTTPEMGDGTGGSYEVLGADQLVLATNWQAIAFQFKMRRVTSLVDYAEKDLDFPAVLKETITILVEDGAAPPERVDEGQ